jgi:hypothetical protein
VRTLLVAKVDRDRHVIENPGFALGAERRAVATRGICAAVRHHCVVNRLMLILTAAHPLLARSGTALRLNLAGSVSTVRTTVTASAICHFFAPFMRFRERILRSPPGGPLGDHCKLSSTAKF